MKKSDNQQDKDKWADKLPEVMPPLPPEHQITKADFDKMLKAMMKVKPPQKEV